ncbi:ATP-binding protein [Lachnospiraceae bacterium ZAX-1]
MTSEQSKQPKQPKQPKQLEQPTQSKQPKQSTQPKQLEQPTQSKQPKQSTQPKQRTQPQKIPATGQLDSSRIAELLTWEKYMKLLLESSPEIILLFDQDGCVTYCTDAFLKLSGIENFDVIKGHPFQELYAAFGDEEFLLQGIKRFEKVKIGHKTIANDVQIDFSRKGRNRMYTVQAAPMLDEAGNFDGVMAVYYDTTDLRNAETDDRTRIMLDATPLACSFWDEKGELLDCNQEAVRMFGLSSKADYLKHLYDLSPPFQPCGLPSRELAEERDAAVMETGYQKFEWMHCTLSGEPLPVETTLVRVPWKGSYAIATYSRDLRKIKASEEKTREADVKNRELEVKTRAAQVASDAKSAFLASMSHEIRTPMNAIIGMSNLMRTDNLDTEQLSYLDDIKKMSQALLHIINDILDFSKIEAGKMDLAPVHFNLHELLDNICSLSLFMAKNKGLAFRSSLDLNLPNILYGDDVRIRQILLNIINNAIKYTREGYVDFKAEYTVKNNRAYLAFLVKDTGIGIKKENFPQLFQTFQQFDTNTNRGIMGTGLGLSITKKLVDLMDGEIAVESEYGLGSSFTIRLPLIRGDTSQVAAKNAIDFSIAKSGTKVLVVDDNNINLKVALAYLAKHNIKADAVTSGYMAIQEIKRNHYDLVFMDHMMPELDGIESTKRIRAMEDGKYGDLPIVALSANAIAGVRETFIAAGMNDFIAKPIDATELNTILLKWLPPEKISHEKSMEENEPTDGYKLKREKGTQISSSEHKDTVASNKTVADLLIVDTKAGIKNAVGDENLYRQLVQNFLKDHKDDDQKISNALQEGDLKTAHRLSHTLKSTAGLIGAKRLWKIAAAMEKETETGGEMDADQTIPLQMQTLNEELVAAIEKLRQMVQMNEAQDEIKEDQNNSSETGHSTFFDKEEAVHLIYRLEPLLNAGNARSLDFINDIKDTLAPLGAKSKILIEQVEDFEFSAAAKTLNILKGLL